MKTGQLTMTAERPTLGFEHRELLAGFIRLHILHHAMDEEIFGAWMMEELARHGYRLSPGTLYPLLHGLEKRGYLVSREEQVGRRHRRLYRATALGGEGLALARAKAAELLREIAPPQHTSGSRR